MNINKFQQLAIDHVNKLSKGPPIDRTLRVTLNFHPDRIKGSIHILESMLQTGIYKSQFETGTSNGGLTAHPGGDRWQWESRIFGNAYDNSPSEDRPKYGSLNFKRSQFGGSPRFGSSYLRLKEAVIDRTTFCYPDSVFDPEAFGTAMHMSLIELAQADDKDLLDDYIEAQVHGELLLVRDVEAIVLDPSHKNTIVEDLAYQLGIRVEWHDGFILLLEEMTKHPDYRGQKYIQIGKEISKGEILTPHIIGEAAATGKYDQQDLKKVWHYLARYGQKNTTTKLTESK